MNILLTGVTGYIGQRLLPILLKEGHTVWCCTRDPDRFNVRYSSDQVRVIKTDFLNEESLSAIPDEIDAAYYLIHSMSAGGGDFSELEKTCAEHFRKRMKQTRVRQVIYLSGIVNEATLSKHLQSRKQVEETLRSAAYALTTLRAGIIIGSGSASFEIIRDLVEKLPVMIAPKWLETRCQPIAIRNVMEFLTRVLLREDTFNRSFDIGSPDILTYREMLHRFAECRGLKRRIGTVPVMTPKLSSYWLYFITSTSYPLARNLVDSMKVEVVCEPNDLAAQLGINLIGYDLALKLAFDKIEQNEVISSWKDALTGDALLNELSEYVSVPVQGCFRDVRHKKVDDPEKVIERIWRIGGDTGWYYGDWLWRFRGFIDKLFGGVGLRRGRKSPVHLAPGDALDFWRVVLADREERRLLLYAEMKLPGEAWLEFSMDQQGVLTQTATFRPLGVWGRLYWYSVLPFHGLIFGGMIRNISG